MQSVLEFPVKLFRFIAYVISYTFQTIWGLFVFIFATIGLAVVRFMLRKLAARMKHIEDLKEKAESLDEKI